MSQSVLHAYCFCLPNTHSAFLSFCLEVLAFHVSICLVWLGLCHCLWIGHINPAPMLSAYSHILWLIHVREKSQIMLRLMCELMSHTKLMLELQETYVHLLKLLWVVFFWQCKFLILAITLKTMRKGAQDEEINGGWHCLIHFLDQAMPEVRTNL